MSDTKILALVLLTVFSAFIFQWAYFSSVSESGEIIWVEDIDIDEAEKIDMEMKAVGIPEEGVAQEAPAPSWYKIWESIPYALGKAGEKVKGIGAKIVSPFTSMWSWIERTHIFDIFTFNIWKNIGTQVPKGIRYSVSLLMGIIVYAIPAYLIVKLIRGGG